MTRLVPSPRDPSLVRVELDGTVAGTILRATCDDLGLREGAAVSTRKLEAIHAAIDLAGARTRGLRMLAARDRTSQALRAALVARGHGERAADETVRLLTADGWIDDTRYAIERVRVLAERALASRAKGRRTPSGAALRAKLLREGLDADTIDAQLRASGIDPRSLPSGGRYSSDDVDATDA